MASLISSFVKPADHALTLAAAISLDKSFREREEMTYIVQPICILD